MGLENGPTKTCLQPTFSHSGGTASLQRCSRADWRKSLDAKTLSFPRTFSCFETIENDDRLGFDLPGKPKLLAGAILAHCFNAVQRILEKYKPCIYKVGYTHCAFWRFYNDLYGYSRERDGWEKLTVIYAGSDTTNCSFIEAALIREHKGPLPKLYGDFCFEFLLWVGSFFHFIWQGCACNPLHGCLYLLTHASMYYKFSRDGTSLCHCHISWHVLKNIFLIYTEPAV